MGYQALLQGIFPTQRSNPGLLHQQADSVLSEPHGECRVGKQQIFVHLFNKYSSIAYCVQDTVLNTKTIAEETSILMESIVLAREGVVNKQMHMVE